MFYNSWTRNNKLSAYLRYGTLEYGNVPNPNNESWLNELNWHIDGEVLKIKQTLIDQDVGYKNGNLIGYCEQLQSLLSKVKINHVKLGCIENYIVIELTEDKEFSFLTKGRQRFKLELPNSKNKLPVNIMTYLNIDLPYVLKIDYEGLGFKHDKLTTKGKYHSVRPIPLFRTHLFLRSNISYSDAVLYNNSSSNILCVFPVSDGEQPIFQTFNPTNCNQKINKNTNHLKFEITDEGGNVIDFGGMPVFIEFEIVVEGCEDRALLEARALLDCTTPALLDREAPTMLDLESLIIENSCN